MRTKTIAVAIALVASAALAGGESKVVKSGQVACTTREAFVQMDAFMRQRDDRGIDSMFERGQCIILRQRWKASILEVSDGAVRARFYVDDDTFDAWTYADAIR